MTTTQGDEFITALRVITNAGYDVLRTDQYKRLIAWMDKVGHPPVGWTPEKSMFQLHSDVRCDNVKILQSVGELKCCRHPGHYGRHWDVITDERW